MGSFSIWHWLIVLMVVLLLFGGGKVSGLMGEFAKGIKAFKKNMAEDDDVPMTGQLERPTPTITTAAQDAPQPARTAKRVETAAHDG